MTETGEPDAGHEPETIQLDDLVDAIDRVRRQLGTDDELDRPALAATLAHDLDDLYMATGDPDALLEGRDVARRGLALSRADHPAHSELADLVGMLSLELYLATGEEADLRLAVENSRRAVDGSGPADPDLPRYLTNHASNLGVLFEVDGDPDVLAEAVTCGRRAVELTPDDDPELPVALSALAVLLRRMYEATGVVGQLREAVEVDRHALARTHRRDPNRPAFLMNLSVGLRNLFEETGDEALLDDAVARAREAMRSADHGDQLTFGSALAACLSSVYEVTGNEEALHEAIELGEAAVDGLSPSHVHYPSCLANHAVHLGYLYGLTRDLAHLRRAIELTQRAVTLADLSVAERARYLNNLSDDLRALYLATGNRDHLERSIAAVREAVAITPDDHGNRPAYLDGLGSRLSELHELAGDRDALDEAVELGRRAIREGHEPTVELATFLSNLAIHLAERYLVTSDVGDLTEAIEHGRRSVALMPTSHIDRPTFLSNLSSHLGHRFTATGSVDDLDEAIDLAEEAVATAAPTHVDVGPFLHNIANRLGDRFIAWGDRSDHFAANAALDRVGELGPRTTVEVERSRAHLARLDDDPAEAASALERALAAYREEVTRSAGDLMLLRDLAGTTEGVIGDLACCYASAGEPTLALQVLERERTWLKAPEGADRTGRTAPAEFVTAWIFSSHWETYVLTSAEPSDPKRVDLTRATIEDAVLDVMDTVRRTAAPTQLTTCIDQLCDLTSQVTEHLPAADDLLLVPLGICGQLPYSAGRTVDGRPLIDRSTITLAASTAWAEAAGSRSRPAGGITGIFNAGRHRPLDLAADRRQFRASYPEAFVADDGATADQALAALDRERLLTHFSCHGHYDRVRPLASFLDAGEPLTLETVISRRRSSWLVNLSACETGVPDLSRSEQMISFPTGFIVGGAAHVLGTIWPVDNTAASAFNHAFYTLLRSGTPPVRAHRTAIGQLRTRPAVASRRYRLVSFDDDPIDPEHPIWWAGFTHYGAPPR